METREVFKRALQDPKLGIEAIIPKKYPKISERLCKS